MIRRISSATVWIVAMLCFLAQGAKAQTYYPVSANALGGWQAMFHFSLPNNEGVAVWFYCGPGPSEDSVTTSGGYSAGKNDVPCTETSSVGADGHRQITVSFPNPQTFTVNGQTITVNPATFREETGYCGRGGCTWVMEPGYNVSITVG